MEKPAIALFGEAERGEYQKGYLCDNLTDLMLQFGNPPSDSHGLFYATQALLYHHPLIYFRVEEEGFSLDDYFAGIKILTHSPLIQTIAAICTPGVGDHKIIHALMPLCFAYHQILIAGEKDLFDYLSSH